MKIVLLGLIFLLGFYGIGQQEIDSLEHLLTTDKTPEDKVEIMSNLVDLYGLKPEAELYLKSLLDVGEKAGGELKSNTLKKAYLFYQKRQMSEIGVDYLIEAISWEKKNSLEGLYHSYELYGKHFKKEMMLDSAIFYYRLAEEGFESLDDNENLIDVLNNEGVLFKDIQNYGEALKMYYKAYDIAKNKGLKKKLASTCVNLGVVFKKQDQLKDAMEYYNEAEAIYVEMDEYIGLANVYNNIGNIFRIEDQFMNALIYYKKAIKNRKLGGSEKTLSYSYNNIALVFKEQLQYDSAIYYLKLSEELKIKLKEQSSIASTYLNFADTYALLNDSVNFKKYYLQAAEFAEKYGQYTMIEELNIIYSKYAAEKGNYKEAYDFLVSVIQQMDTLSNKEQVVLSKVLQAQYNDKQKKDLIVELESSLAKQEYQRKELEEQAGKLKANEENLWLLIIFLVIVFVLFAVALIVMFNSLKKLKDGAKEYERINKELKETRVGAEEKDMMIKEIHHRVKNNLQVVKSLIRLQRENVGEEKSGLFTDFENRVSSIALVHESLHGSVDLTKVDVREYYQRLIQDLIEVYSVQQQIESTVNIDELSFGLDTLIPLGLLTNEIVSNALKHAFKGKDKGCIDVSIKQLNSNEYRLEISDDGQGISEEFFEKSSLGLELIDALVEQLDGSKELIIENGTRYIVEFKNQDKIK